MTDTDGRYGSPETRTSAPLEQRLYAAAQFLIAYSEMIRPGTMVTWAQVPQDEEIGAANYGHEKLLIIATRLHDAVLQFREERRMSMGEAREITLLMNGMEIAWGVISNAMSAQGAGDDPDWRKAAERWRDDYWHPALERNGYPTRGQKQDESLEEEASAWAVDAQATARELQQVASYFDRDSRSVAVIQEAIRLLSEEKGYENVCGPDTRPNDALGWITSFAAWLTTRSRQLWTGRGLDAAPVAEAVEEYRKLFDLPEIGPEFWPWMQNYHQGVETLQSYFREVEAEDKRSRPIAPEERLRSLEAEVLRLQTEIRDLWNAQPL